MTSGSTTRTHLQRRQFLAAGAGLLAAGWMARGGPARQRQAPERKASEHKAQICITFDLEMSRDYPKRGMLEWDYEKGNLDDATKEYSVKAARLVSHRGGKMHFFCVGRVLEQSSVTWLQEIAALGHAIGNHTYDHVNLLARKPEEIQFRFRRAPWLIAGRSVEDVLRENIRLTTLALKERAGITANGFRAPGGFAHGLAGREDLQQMLLNLGFAWVSGKYPPHKSGTPKVPPDEVVYADIVRAQREAQPFVYPTGLIEIPMSPISDVNAFRTHNWKLEYFMKAVELAVRWAIENRAVFDFLAHPSCLVVEDPKLETIARICELVETAKDQAELVTLDAVARHVPRQ